MSELPLGEPEKSNQQKDDTHLLPWIAVAFLALSVICLAVAWVVFTPEESKIARAAEKQGVHEDFIGHIVYEAELSLAELEAAHGIEELSLGEVSASSMVSESALEKVKIAIVIDDVGVVESLSERAVKELPAGITLSFLPYGDATERLVAMAHDDGHEVMVHLPMEPKANAEGNMPNPGPNALYVDDRELMISTKTWRNLSPFDGVAVGVNNHMGSRFTGDAKGLKTALEEIKRHDMFFLDSITTNDSKASEVGAEVGVPILRRDVFLDHFIDEEKIHEYLEKLVNVARKRGRAIGIAHPHKATLHVLNEWIANLPEDVELVGITRMLEQ